MIYMKSILRSILFFNLLSVSIIYPSMTYSKTPNNLSVTGEKVFDNGQIGVIVGKVIRGKEPSKEIMDKFRLPPDDKIDSPSKGSSLFYVVLEFKYTTGIHVTSVDRERSVLVDRKRNRYVPRGWAAVGLQLEDPHDVTKKEFALGTQTVFIFEIPDRAKPDTFQLTYLFKMEWQDTELSEKLSIKIPK